jgi:hypothetical protein
MEQENEILQRLTRIETKLDMKIEKLNDHEKRIRFLERYAFVLLGIFSLVVMIIETFVKKG